LPAANGPHRLLHNAGALAPPSRGHAPAPLHWCRSGSAAGGFKACAPRLRSSSTRAKPHCD
jgi:hypothetical protein